MTVILLSCCHIVIVKIVMLVGLIGMHKRGCSGETGFVLHIPSSS